MYQVETMHDCEGTEIRKGDFVQLTEGKMPYINRAMRKGIVLKVSYIENRPIEKKPFFVAFLTDKKGTRLYQSGVSSEEILKVDYCMKKRKIIGEKRVQMN